MSENEEKDYIDIALDLEDEVTKEVQRGVRDVVTKLADTVNQLIWQMANDYIHTHLEVDVLNNYQNAVRDEVCRCAHIWVRDRESFWGKDIRLKLFEEHKDEILPLIVSDVLEERDQEIARLNKTIEILSRQRY
jgi:hypothetical protein